MLPNRFVLLIAAALASATLAGCGGGEAAEPAAPAAAPATTQTTTVAATQAPAAEGATVAVGDSAFGPIVVDGKTGLTLYLFTDDPSGKTVCPPGSDDDLYSDRKSTRLNSSHIQKSRMPSSA